MTLDDFGKVFHIITTTTNLYTYGRLNINTAAEAVLTAFIHGREHGSRTGGQCGGVADHLPSSKIQPP